MEEETIRRPDSTRRECLVPSSSSLPSRSRSRPYSRRGNRNEAVSNEAVSNEAVSNEAVITWEEEDADLKEALRQSALEADALAVKERLEKEAAEKERLEKERLEKEAAEKERLEKERVEACLQKYGFVQSRLRLMEHPSDPIPSRLLERIRWETVLDREKPPSPPPSLGTTEEKEWVRKRAEKSPLFGVLFDLLEKK